MSEKKNKRSHCGFAQCPNISRIRLVFSLSWTHFFSIIKHIRLLTSLDDWIIPAVSAVCGSELCTVNKITIHFKCGKKENLSIYISTKSADEGHVMGSKAPELRPNR